MSRISRVGHYEGYTARTYDGFIRQSLYVPMADGVRLAVDYFIPTRDGRPPSDPLPVIFQMTPYNRAQIVDGKLVHILSPYAANGRTYDNNLLDICLHGYAMAAADVRGQGASFGTYSGCMSAEEGRDGAEIIAWLRAQPWCDGKVGMLGSSYGAATQLLVAAQHPPGLVALYACHIYFDAYDAFFPGGVRELQIPRVWGRLVDDLAGRTAPSLVAPVDGPEGPTLLSRALTEHQSGGGAAEIFAQIGAHPARDGTGFFLQATKSGSQNLCTLLPSLKNAAIPAYHHGGWNDFFPDQTAKWYLNWTAAPSKLVLGPWSHSPRCFTSPRDEEDLRIRSVESRRWFDYWLKGIDNGILEEPAVHYAIQTSHPFRALPTSAGEDQWQWRSSVTWPLGPSSAKRFWLGCGPSGTIHSVNDGVLHPNPRTADHSDSWQVDGTVSTGDRNRMGGPFNAAPVMLPDMTPIDARCLTYTSEALPEDLLVVGTPLVTLFVTSTAPDAALFFWLEDVDPQGHSTLITHACLRASHRMLGSPWYDTGGARWHDSTRATVAAAASLNQETALIEVSLQPIANRFQKSHRIRLTISGSDQGNFEAVEIGATLSVLTGRSHPSHLELPIGSGRWS